MKEKKYSKMKPIEFIKRFFGKYKRSTNPFSEAISEGIKEAFKEVRSEGHLKNKT